ncbi:MAG: hypothetical protein F4Y24_08635 [Gemmatimonadetes bacterium]|nr:hypothetical protein [Gemmatimonadota bacterium]MYG23576.1 hypothetical protein [Gemmatimonadota bacterium]MYJ38815.1 hypothetical protein [Gemmatimonadota bacterium]
MDRLPGIIVLALFGAILRPPIAEVGISGGPHWPEFDARETFRRTAIGLTAHSGLNEYFGVQFGGGYKQGGVERCVARRKDEATFPAQRQAPTGATPPCVLPDMLETHEAETVHRLYDYVDLSMLGQARIPVGDLLDVRFVLGPTWGVPVKCRRKSVSHGGVQDCSTAYLSSDWRLVVGAGAGLQISPRLDLSFDYRYGADMRDLIGYGLDPWLGISSSLIAGLHYRIGS